MPRCEVCFRHCTLSEGQRGFCGARICENGAVISENYGKITSVALDPIEKKPLNRFHPGKMILSVGSYGCNLRCPFCQNYDISWSELAMSCQYKARYLSPEELTKLALSCKDKGNIGVAFTYNEPLIGYEYVRDTAKLIHDAGMLNVLVSNGTAELAVLEELLPHIDAMNIDLKGFSESYYNKTLGGDLESVKAFIKKAVQFCHVELTTLIVPQENDSENELKQISEWIAEMKNKNGTVIGHEIPLHISRFFPRFNMTDRSATNVELIYHLADIARQKLKYVYTGNC